MRRRLGGECDARSNARSLTPAPRPPSAPSAGGLRVPAPGERAILIQLLTREAARVAYAAPRAAVHLEHRKKADALAAAEALARDAAEQRAEAELSAARSVLEETDKAAAAALTRADIALKKKTEALAKEEVKFNALLDSVMLELGLTQADIADIAPPTQAAALKQPLAPVVVDAPTTPAKMQSPAVKPAAARAAGPGAVASRRK